MRTRTLPIGLLLVFALYSVMGCANNPASPDGVASAPGVDEGNGVTKEQAIQIALAAVPGKVIESELDKENGRQVYEVEIKTDAGVKEVQIDPDTGEILKIEDDDDDDDKFLGIF